MPTSVRARAVAADLGWASRGTGAKLRQARRAKQTGGTEEVEEAEAEAAEAKADEGEGGGEGGGKGEGEGEGEGEDEEEEEEEVADQEEVLQREGPDEAKLLSRRVLTPVRSPLRNLPLSGARMIDASLSEVTSPDLRLLS